MTKLAPDVDMSVVPAGSNVLVVGPPMTGKRRLLYELLSVDGASDRATGLVTTRKPSDMVAMGYREYHPAVHSLAIVDCVSRQQGFASGQTTRRRQYVSNAGDLTGIGIAVSEAIREFEADSEIGSASIGVHTLSTLLMYADLRRVFQFLHVLTGRISAAGFLGGFVLETPVPENSLGIITQIFDGAVEVRDDDETGDRQYRVRGFSEGAGPRRWTDF
jgi:KaiC/GvpD/RAD55 family RecA-like ATPase